MPRSRFIYVFVYFLIFIPSLLVGLLPDNVVFMGRNGNCPVKKLKLGDRLVSSMITSYRQRNKYSNISGIKINKNLVNSAILIVLESKNKTISSILVGHDQKFCIQIDGRSKSFMWVEAKSLEQNMFLLGYSNKKFRVRDVQRIKLKSSINTYEISLSKNNTFYLADSNGNLIMTHNMIGILGCMVIGAVIGGTMGGGITIYHSYKKGLKVSAGNVAKGVVVGATAGAVVAGVAYVGVYVTVNYLPQILEKINTKILSTFCKAENVSLLVPLDINLINNTIPIVNKAEQIINKAEQVYFVGILVRDSVKDGLMMTYNYVDQLIDEVISETKRRDDEDIDANDLDKGGRSKRNFYNDQFEECPYKSKALIERTALDVNSRPAKNDHGSTMSLMVSLCNN